MYILSLLTEIDSENIKTIIELIALLSIVFTAFNYMLSRRKNFFDAVKSCHERYQKIVEKQQLLRIEQEEDIKNDVHKPDNDYLERHLILFRDHLGLICEEIFYIREGILPKTVAYSWLAEMSGRIPFFEKVENEMKVKNEIFLDEGENKWLFKNDFSEMKTTFKNFRRLHDLFQMDDKEDPFMFSIEYNDWKIERRRFAHYIYKRIRGNRYERFINLFRRTWKHGRW